MLSCDRPDKIGKSIKILRKGSKSGILFNRPNDVMLALGTKCQTYIYTLVCCPAKMSHYLGFRSEGILKALNGTLVVAKT